MGRLGRSAATLVDPPPEQLLAVPASAEVRAIFLRIAEAKLHAIQRDAHVSWTSRFGPTPPSYRMVPVREFLVRVHAAAMLVSGTLEAGLARLYAHAAKQLLAEPGADLFVAKRDREPLRLLRRLEISRPLIASYGEWRVREATPRSVEIDIEGEHLWIDLLWRPIVASVFPAFGLVADVGCALGARGQGRMWARW
jgi:hypothetical protein